MGIYRNIEKTLQDMVYELIQSEDIAKLLYYNDKDPLGQPVVENPQRMIFTGQMQEEDYHRIFIAPKIATVTDYKKTIVIPRIERIRPSSSGGNKNVYYKDFIVTFDVFTHVSLYTMAEGRNRIFAILDEIDSVYALKYNEKSIGNPIPVDTSYIQPSAEWCGYRIEYKFTGWAGGSCDSN